MYLRMVIFVSHPAEGFGKGRSEYPIICEWRSFFRSEKRRRRLSHLAHLFSFFFSIVWASFGSSSSSSSPAAVSVRIKKGGGGGRLLHCIQQLRNQAAKAKPAPCVCRYVYYTPTVGSTRSPFLLHCQFQKRRRLLDRDFTSKDRGGGRRRRRRLFLEPGFRLLLWAIRMMMTGAWIGGAGGGRDNFFLSSLFHSWKMKNWVGWGRGFLKLAGKRKRRRRRLEVRFSGIGDWLLWQPSPLFFSPRPTLSSSSIQARRCFQWKKKDWFQSNHGRHR